MSKLILEFALSFVPLGDFSVSVYCESLNSTLHTYTRSLCEHDQRVK